MVGMGEAFEEQGDTLVMADFLPFAAIRYDGAKVPIREVVAPPYDVIDPDHRERLKERHPNNVVHLILGEGNWYQNAARAFREWQGSGVLMQDKAPSFYLYKQCFVVKGKEYCRWKILGRLRLEPLGKGRVFPHEKTLAGPKQDRLRLYNAVRANLSPVFGVFRDEKGIHGELTRDVSGYELLYSFKDHDGLEQSLWRLPKEAESLVIEGVRDQSIFIADGHHRYETALLYQQQRMAENPHHSGDEPYNFVLMALVSMNDPGLLVLPTHRVLKRGWGRDDREISERLHGLCTVEARPDSLDDLLNIVVSAHDKHLFGVYSRDMGFSVLKLRDEAVPSGRLNHLPPCLKGLQVSIFHTVVVEDVLGLSPEVVEREAPLIYFKNAPQALEAVERGEGRYAFFLNAPTLDEIASVAESGETMPQKSTFFYPKLTTGLVFYSLE